MKYEEETTEINTAKSSAWLIKLDNEEILAIWHPYANIKDVINYYKVHVPEAKFTVQRIDNGEFLLAKIYGSISLDGRKVNQDFEVVI